MTQLYLCCEKESFSFIFFFAFIVLCENALIANIKFSLLRAQLTFILIAKINFQFFFFLVIILISFEKFCVIAVKQNVCNSGAKKKETKWWKILEVKFVHYFWIISWMCSFVKFSTLFNQQPGYKFLFYPLRFFTILNNFKVSTKAMRWSKIQFSEYFSASHEMPHSATVVSVVKASVYMSVHNQEEDREKEKQNSTDIWMYFHCMYV